MGVVTGTGESGTSRRLAVAGLPTRPARTNPSPVFDAAYLAYRPVDLNSKRERVISAVGGAFEAFVYVLGAMVGVVIGLDWVVRRLLGRAGPPNEDQRFGLWVLAGLALLGALALLGRARRATPAGTVPRK
jgi:hypothetical protein